MRKLFGSSQRRLGPLAWLALYSVTCLAAESAAQVVTGRTLETLPTLAWLLAIVYSVIGWIMANLKKAVMAMNSPAEGRLAARAGVFAEFVAAMFVGVNLCLFLLTEVHPNGRPLPALYAYFGAAIGAFGGMVMVNIIFDAFKEIASRWVQRGGKAEGG